MQISANKTQQTLQVPIPHRFTRHKKPEAQGDSWVGHQQPDLLTQSVFEQQVCASKGCKISILGQADLHSNILLTSITSSQTHLSGSVN